MSRSRNLTTRQLIRHWLIAVVVAAAAVSPAWADGMIVPIRPDIPVRGHWAVTYHHVDISVRHQVASVSITQEFVNTGSGMIEVEYLFPVPPDAAINSMTLMVNGKEFPAKLMKADEARRIYEEIVRRKKDPALLEYAGFGLYRTRAFPLEPNKPAKVVVNYRTICKKDTSTVEVWYPLNTEKFSAKPIRDVTIRVDVESPADITTVYSPLHKITIDRKSPRRLVATYHAQNVTPTADFQLFYKSANEEVGATLLTYQATEAEDGYFLMLVSPNPRTASTKIIAKDVVLVLDRSGSMGGEKIGQAREAAAFVLNNLNKGDRINVLVYNDVVEAVFTELQPATRKVVETATARIGSLQAAGGTDIDAALQMAIKMFPTADGKDPRPKYIIFLTDGLPTVGTTDETVILSEAKRANAAGARLFAFGVGYDVNVRMLDKLVLDNGGRSDYVKPTEPIEAKVSSLYKKIKNPVMTGLKVAVHGVKLVDVYPRELGDLFEGDQLVIVGRLAAKDVQALVEEEVGVGVTQVVVTGTYDGKERGFEYPTNILKTDKRHPFVQTLWAVRRIGWLLDQIQLHGESKEVVDELIRLSLTYGIITPYTSFLADEGTALNRPTAVRAAALEGADSLAGEITGGAGQRGAKSRQVLNTADRVPEPSVPAAESGVAMVGNANQDAYDRGEQEQVANVRRAGGQALYRRGRQWVAANATQVDLDRDADKVVVIDRMSEEYFELARANTVAENQILASQQADEELVIELRGQVYLIK